MALRTLSGMWSIYTSAVVLMCLWRRMACASFMVPCFCRSVPNVRRNTWKVQRFRGMPSLSLTGHTFHLKKFFARNGTASPLFLRCCPYHKIHRAPDSITQDLKTHTCSGSRSQWVKNRAPPQRAKCGNVKADHIGRPLRQAARRSYRWCRPPTSGNSTTLPSSGG